MINISGMTAPPDIELKNCLLFSCSAIFASNNGAVTPLVSKNFSYLVLENLPSLKKDLSFLPDLVLNNIDQYKDFLAD